MAAYDPKRPRPSAASGPDEAPPVDALLDPTPEASLIEESPVEEATIGEVAPDVASPPPLVDEVDLRAATSTNGNGSRPAPKRVAEVPIAPAPEEGTANRAVLIAALVSTGVLGVLITLLVRRRRHREA